MRRALSRWWRPMDGSSRMYSTPIRLRPDLGGEPDPLRLAAGQRPRGAVQGQVVEPDVDEESEPRPDLLEHLDRDLVLARVEALREAVVPRERIGHRAARRLDDVPTRDRHGQRLRLQAHAVAGRTRLVRHVALVLGPHRLGAGLAIASGQVRDHALEGGLEDVGVAVARPVLHVDALALVPVQQDLARLLREVADGNVRPEAVVLGHRVEDLREPALGGWPSAATGGSRPRRRTARRSAGRGPGRSPAASRGRCSRDRRRAAS